MSATVEEKTELEKICAGLEAKIASINIEVVQVLKKHKADLDAANGDARLIKEAIEKEVIELEAKKEGLQGQIVSQMAAINAEKVKLALENEILLQQRIDLEKPKNDLNAALNAFAAVKEEYQIRANDLTAGIQKLEEDKKIIEEKIAAATATVDQANKDHAEAQKVAGEAAALFNEATQAIQDAEKKANDILFQAQKKLDEANSLMVIVTEKQTQAEANMTAAKELKDQYTKKLEESQDYARQNSELAENLSAWEVTLEHLKNRLQDDQAKLKQAEIDFAAKLKGETKNG